MPHGAILALSVDLLVVECVNCAAFLGLVCYLV